MFLWRLTIRRGEDTYFQNKNKLNLNFTKIMLDNISQQCHKISFLWQQKKLFYENKDYCSQVTMHHYYYYFFLQDVRLLLFQLSLKKEVCVEHSQVCALGNVNKYLWNLVRGGEEVMLKEKRKFKVEWLFLRCNRIIFLTGVNSINHFPQMCWK